MAWQFTSQQPIYQQIVHEISRRIFSGMYPKGEKLPSVRELAVTAAVNPNTMQRALSELEGLGLVCTQRTSGRTVTTDQSAIDAARREWAERLADAFVEQMDAIGLEAGEVFDLLNQRLGGQNSKEGNDGNDGNDA